MTDPILLLDLLEGLSADGRLFKGELSEIGREAIRGGRMQFEDILIIFGGLLTLMSGLSLVAWLRTQRLSRPAVWLFNQVARDTGLTRADRRLLRKISRRAELPTPLTLLLCPGTLGHHARRCARQDSVRRGTLDLARAASIRRYLFGPQEASGA